MGHIRNNPLIYLGMNLLGVIHKRIRLLIIELPMSDGRHLPSEIRGYQFVMLIKLYFTPISLDENVEDRSGPFVSVYRKWNLVR
jgi:hypothetical protein